MKLLMLSALLLLQVSAAQAQGNAGEPRFYFNGLDQDKTISVQAGKPFKLNVFIAPPEDAKPLDANSEAIKHSQEISNGKILTLTATCSLALKCKTGVSLIRIYYDNASQKSTQATFEFIPTNFSQEEKDNYVNLEVRLSNALKVNQFSFQVNAK